MCGKYMYLKLRRISAIVAAIETDVVFMRPSRAPLNSVLAFTLSPLIARKDMPRAAYVGEP